MKKRAPARRAKKAHETPAVGASIQSLNNGHHARCIFGGSFKHVSTSSEEFRSFVRRHNLTSEVEALALRGPNKAFAARYGQDPDNNQWATVLEELHTTPEPASDDD